MTGPRPVNGGRPAQSTVEYGLLIATVAILALLVGYTFGQNMSAWWQALLAHILSAGSVNTVSPNVGAVFFCCW